MIDYPIAIMYLGTLSAGCFAFWIYSRGVQKQYKQDMKELREEMSSLAMSMGLRKRQGPNVTPPTFGG